MSRIYDEFLSLVSSRPNYRARGFININCPACGDKRKRGGFAPTETGGFRYFCFNGGCTFSTEPTGWEPGNGLYGRVRSLFEMLGGNIRNIPVQDMLRQNNTSTGMPREERAEVVTKFRKMDMPKGSILIEEAVEEDERAIAVLNYLNNRSPLLLGAHPFMWSPIHPEHLLVPYVHHGTIVGYMGRHIGESAGQKRFLQRSRPDYMFNQHLLSKGAGKYAYVLESPLDAILMQGVATKENRLTKRQVNLLKSCGKEPVLIPDIKKGEAAPYVTTAEENDWFISVPEWPNGFTFKDVGEAIQRIGLLATIEAITSSMTKNYASAKIKLGVKG